MADTRKAAGADRERIFTFPFVLLMAANGLLRTGMQMLIALVPLYTLDHRPGAWNGGGGRHGSSLRGSGCSSSARPASGGARTCRC
ncbi:hypothetical protein [Actinomadura physcomitrii]|uniref:hypothetical protein n=1 Tax=Actinomadura physcomitrii TaxID=2650748 RepID=UPI002E25FB1F